MATRKRNRRHRRVHSNWLAVLVIRAGSARLPVTPGLEISPDTSRRLLVGPAGLLPRPSIDEITRKAYCIQVPLFKVKVK